MKKEVAPAGLKDGVRCRVVEGVHKGKSGVVSDIKTSKTGHLTLTVTKADGDRLKTLARNIEIVK